MGRLIAPASGAVYAAANIALYTVNSHPVYAPLCVPLWQAAQEGKIVVVSSELTLMETMVGPLRAGDTVKAAFTANLWNRPGASLTPITRAVLQEAARLRASIPGLKTPDAIHAATSLSQGCALFLTNDMGFKRVPGLPLVLLDEVLAS